MSERPRRLLWQADLVVRASRELRDLEKLVWLEDRNLDLGAEGAFIGAGELAERLGRSRDAIERTRRVLRDLGLHATRRINGRRTASWYAVLPDSAIPALPFRAEVDEYRPPPEDVRRLADYLDAHVRAVRGRRSYDRTGGSDAANQRDEVAASMPPVKGASGGTDSANGGSGAASTGGMDAPQMAAAVPPRSSKDSEFVESRTQGVRAVAYATPAHRDRCPTCGDPVHRSPAGRLLLCPQAWPAAGAVR